MKIYEIGTGYTPIPARVSAATESVVEELTKAYMQMGQSAEIIDISASDRAENSLPITEVKVPSVFTKSDVSLGLVHKLKRVVYSVALAFELKKILKSQKENTVLHFHNQYNLFFFTKLVSKKLRSKAVIAYTNHNGMWSLPWDEVKDTLHKRYFQEIAAMKSADLIFVLNKNTKKNIVSKLGIDESRVVEIRNGVNTDVYRPLSETEIEKIKVSHGLSGKQVILQVGSVYENKGQVRCVEMLAPLLKKYDSLVYAYAGGIVSQEYAAQVEASARKYGISDKVIYLGSVAPGEEMNRIYNLACATVFASEYEGFPLVCAESLSAGVPVIICSDLSINLGAGSVQTDKDNIEKDIENAVILNTDAHKRLCLDARENTVNNYLWQNVAQEHITSFTEKVKINVQKT